MNRGNVCEFINCGKTRRDHPNLHMYKIPKDEVRAKKWILNSGNKKLLRYSPESLNNRLVCEDHFSELDFTPKKRLQKTAIPRPYHEPPIEPSMPESPKPSTSGAATVSFSHQALPDNISSNPSTSSSNVSSLVLLKMASLKIIKCRTCWEDVDIRLCTQFDKKCHERIPSIKEMIVLCVPEVRYSIKSDDYICKYCLEKLQISVGFYELCISAEDKIKEKDNEKNEETDGQYDFLDNYIDESNTDNNCFDEDIENLENLLSDGDENELNGISDNIIDTEDALVTNILDSKIDLGKTDVLVKLGAPFKENDKTHLRLKNDLIENGVALYKMPSCIPGKQKRIFFLCVTEKREINNINVPHTFQKKDPFIVPKTYSSHISAAYFEHEAHPLQGVKKVNIPKSDLVISLKYPRGIQSDFYSYDIPIFKKPNLDPKKGKRLLLFANFPNPFDEILNSETNYNQGYFVCPVCPKEYRNQTALQSHVTREHCSGHFVAKCSACDASFAKTTYLDRHIEKMHRKLKLYKCTRCEKKFGTRQYLRRHERVTNYSLDCSYELFKCTRCEATFSRKDRLQHHLEKTRDAPVCDYKQCKTCKIKLSKSAFKAHLKVHPVAKKPETEAVCDTCGKICKSRPLLKEHQKRIHINAYFDICPYCAKEFKTKAGLPNHIKTVHAKRTKNHLCDMCPKTFYTARDLRKHKRRHEGNPQLSCKLCEKKFIETSELRIHERLIHLKIQPYVCKICDRKFGRKDYLRNHLRQHTGEPYFCKISKRYVTPMQRIRPEGQKFTFRDKTPGYNKALKYVCKFCNKTCSTRLAVMTHYRSHLKIRPYKCGHCEETFLCRSGQLRHEKLHKNSDYNLSCRICFKKSSSEKEFEKHMAKHKNKYPCQHCNKSFARKYLLNIHVGAEHGPQEEAFEMYHEALRSTAIINVNEKNSE